MPGEAGDHAIVPLNGGYRLKGEMTKSPGIGLHLQVNVGPLKLVGLRPDAKPEVLGGKLEGSGPGGRDDREDLIVEVAKVGGEDQNENGLLPSDTEGRDEARSR